MIEINLLPDIKRQYLKSQRIKGFFMLGAFAASAAAISAVILVWFFTIGQNIHMNRLQSDIEEAIAEIQSVEDLDRVVTIQNQLAEIEGLTDQKPEVALLFGYLSKLTPNTVDLGSVQIQFGEEDIFEIQGLGKNYKAINTFIDTLKNAGFNHKDIDEPQDAFQNVVLAGASEQEEGKISFKIVFSFDEGVFDNNLQDLVLTVPNITSTQSETERPKSLFEPNAQNNDPETVEEEQQ